MGSDGLFELDDQTPWDGGAEAGAPAGSHARTHAPCADVPLRVDDRGEPGLAGQWRRVWLAGWRHRMEAHFARLDIAPDLAEEIGSRRWFRGLGTLFALALAAFSFWPDFTTVEAATTMRIDDATRDEFRSQMITPLATGGETGRRMGATAAVVPLTSAPERAQLRFTATLGHTDSFALMLRRAGLSERDAGAVSGLIESAVAPQDIAPGTKFDVTLGKRAAPGLPRPLEALQFRARFDLDLAISRRGEQLLIERRPVAVDSTPLRITGTVGESLYRSARAAGAPMKAIEQYLQTIDRHVSLDGDIAPTDHFDMVVAYRRSARGESAVGDLLYAGLERDGRPQVQLLRWGQDGQFFDASGTGEQTTSRQFSPVAGHITSYFGMRRHPILGYVRLHGGVDFGASWGSPIYAATTGTVSFAGRHGGHGNFVRLEHGGGLATGYAHMSRIAVAPGMQVAAGQVIGYVGSTGLSTGPHLHFEAYRDGQRVDPLALRFTTQAAVDKKQISAFTARLAALKAITPGAALASFKSRSH